MKTKRIITAVLALVLAFVPSCRNTQNDDGTAETNEKTTAPDNSADISDHAGTIDKTTPPAPAEAEADILTHVFTETSVSLEDGEIKPPFGAAYSINDGKLSIIGSKKVPTVGVEYYNEYYLTTLDLETGAREDRKLDIEDGFFPGMAFVAGDILYVPNTRPDPVTYINKN